QGAQLEAYLEKYAELGAAQDLPVELIAEEYRVRHSLGDKPKLESYRQRFPIQFAELQRLVEQEPPPTLTLPPSPEPASPVVATAPKVGTEQTAALRPSSSDTLPIGAGYRLLKRIGSGTFGEVWQAEAPGGVPVAVKMIIRPVDHAEAQRELHA